MPNGFQPRFTEVDAADEWDLLVRAGLDPEEAKRRIDQRLHDEWNRLVGEGAAPEEATQLIQGGEPVVPTGAKSLAPPVEKQIMRGLGETGAAAISSLEALAPTAALSPIPAVSQIGQILDRARPSEKIREEQKEFFGEPQTPGQEAARIGGRIGGELAIAAPAAAGLLTKVPRAASRAGQAVRFGAAEAPVAGAIELGQPEGESIAEMVGLEGTPGQRFAVGTGVGAAGGAVVGLLSKPTQAVVRALKNPDAAVVARDANQFSLSLDDQPRPEGSIYRFFQRASDKTKRYARAIYTSAPATALRNFYSGVVRMPLSVLEDAVGETIAATARTKNPFRGVEEGMEQMIVSFRSWKDPNTRRIFLEMLERMRNMDPDEFQKFYIAASDAPGGERAIKLFQLLNRTQEGMVRRPTYVARLGANINRIARAQGRTFDDVVDEFDRLGWEIDAGPVQEEVLDQLTKGSDLHKSMLDGVMEALDVTFASPPSAFSEPIEKFLRFTEDFPFLWTAQPFVRFAMNSNRWFWERALSFLGPNLYRGFDPKSIASTRKIAKLTEGGLFFGAGLATRAEVIPGIQPGPKYYQVVNFADPVDAEGNTNYIDMRPFDPFVKFMLVGEYVRAAIEGDAPNVTPEELAEAFSGIRRLTGGPALVMSFFTGGKADTPEALGRRLKRGAREFVGSFGTAFRTLGLSSFIQFFDERERIRRETDETKLPVVGTVLNELIAKAPFAKQLLPERPSPFRTEQAGESETRPPFLGRFPRLPPDVVRDLSGLSIVPSTPLEERLRKLALEGKTARPRTRTGLDTLDRLIDESMGDQVEMSNLDELMNQPHFKNLPVIDQANEIGEEISRFRSETKTAILQGPHAQEILDEAMAEVEGIDFNKARIKVAKWQVPQWFKDDVLNRLQQQIAQAEQEQLPSPPPPLSQSEQAFVERNRLPRADQAPGQFQSLRV